MTDTQAIEQYINNGGAVGESQRALATGNKVATLGVKAGVGVASAGMGVAGSGAVATATTSALTSVSSALVSAGVTSATVPVAGWIVAGVLVATAGGIAIASKRRAKFLAKDRGLLQKYIQKFEKKSSDWRLKESKKQIAQIQFLLTKRQSNRNLKRKAKAELKLEALYFIYSQERLPVLQQQAQIETMQKISMDNKRDLLIWTPVAIAIIGASIWFAKK